MDRYLLIASRDRFTARDVDEFCELGAGLAVRGHPVTVLLVQNAVLGARSGPDTDPIARLTRAGVTVLAEEFSLRERGIAPDRLASGVTVASLGCVIDALADGARVLWS